MLTAACRPLTPEGGSPISGVGASLSERSGESLAGA